MSHSRELVHDFLKALATRFDDETTKIDTSVANAARVMRRPGTLNARETTHPYRTDGPGCCRCPRTVSPSMWSSAVAKPERPLPTTSWVIKTGTARTHDTIVDIEKMTAWLEEHELDTRNGKPWKGTGAELESCPFTDHDRGEAWVAVMPTGAKAAGCQHNPAPGNGRTSEPKSS